MSDNVNSLADPFYVRAIAGRIASGAVTLDDPSTIPVDLTAELDQTWLSLPTDHRFLLHRMLGLLALMREPATDDAIVSILGAPNVFAEDVADLRRHIAHWLMFKGDGYVLAHDRLKTYLTGGLAGVSQEDITEAGNEGGAGKFRLNDLCALHGSLVAFYDVARVSCGDSMAGALDRMTDSGLRFLTWHLGQIAVLNTVHPDTEDKRTPARDRLYDLMRNEEYRKVSVERFLSYDAVMDDLGTALHVYSGRQGRLPQDDARLCWLALRAANLGALARHDIRAALERVLDHTADDTTCIEDAVRRLTPVSLAGGDRRASALLWLMIVEAESVDTSQLSDSWRASMDLLFLSLEEAIKHDCPKEYWYLSCRPLIQVCVDRLDRLSPQLGGRLVQFTGPAWDAAGVEGLISMSHLAHARDAAALIKDPSQKVRALVNLAAAEAREGSRERASSLFAEAQKLLSAMPANRGTVSDMAFLAAALSAAGHTDRADSLFAEARTAANMFNPIEREEALADLSQGFSRCDRLAEAEDLAFGSWRRVRQISALVALAVAFWRAARTQDMDRCFDAALEEADGSARRYPPAAGFDFGNVFVGMVECGQIDHVRGYAKRIRDTDAAGKKIAGTALLCVVEQLSLKGDIGGAASLANETDDPVFANQHVAQALAANGRIAEGFRLFAESQQVVPSHEDIRECIKSSLPHLIRTLVRLEHFMRASALARRLEAPKRLVLVLSHWAAANRRAGKHRAADQKLRLIRGTLEKMRRQYPDIQTCLRLKEMIALLADSGLWQEALVEMDRLPPSELFDGEAWVRIIRAASRAGNLAEARRVFADLNGNDAYRVAALAAMAASTTGAEHAEEQQRLFSEAERILSTITDEYKSCYAAETLCATYLDVQRLDDCRRLLNMTKSEAGKTLKAQTALALAGAGRIEDARVTCMDLLTQLHRKSAPLNTEEIKAAVILNALSSQLGTPRIAALVHNTKPVNISVEVWREATRETLDSPAAISELRKTFLYGVFRPSVAADGVIQFLSALVAGNHMREVGIIARECRDLEMLVMRTGRTGAR